MQLYWYFSMCCIACWSCRIAVAVVLGSLSMIHGRKQNASLLKVLQFTSHCWGWAAQAAYLAILDISIDHYSPSTMQVMYWFIILNMKLTLNHAVVDLSHALTRKSIALLPGFVDSCFPFYLLLRYALVPLYQALHISISCQIMDFPSRGKYDDTYISTTKHWEFSCLLE